MKEAATLAAPDQAATRTIPALPFDPLLVLIVSTWALNISLVKIALVDFPPVAFNFLRLAVAAVILLGSLLATEKNIRIARKDLPKILVLAFSGYAVAQTLVILGIRLTSATNVAVLAGISPILISLLSSFFKHDRISRLGWLGVVLGFTGAFIVISSRSGGFRFSEQTHQGRHPGFPGDRSLGAFFGVGKAAGEDLLAAQVQRGDDLPGPALLSPLFPLLAQGGPGGRDLGPVLGDRGLRRRRSDGPGADHLVQLGEAGRELANGRLFQPAAGPGHRLRPPPPRDSVGGGLAAGAALVVLGIYLTRRGRTALPAPLKAPTNSP